MRPRGGGRIFQPTYRDASGAWRRSNVWWCGYRVPGRPKEGKERGGNKAEATAKLKQRLGEIGQGDWLPPAADRTTLAQVLDLIRTRRALDGRPVDHLDVHERRLTRYFGPEARVTTLTPDRLDGYAAARKAEGAANATINRELACLRRGLRLALRAGLIRRVPVFTLLREANLRQGFFEAAELARVLAALPAALRPVVLFASLTGWRKAECLALRWAALDRQAGVIRLEPGTTKNEDGRVFPYSRLPALVALIDEQHERTRALERAEGRVIPWVFHRAGRPIRGFRRAWLAATRAAGIDGRLFHDLRRTAVRNLERAGVPRSVAMKLTGHKTESVYRRYAIAAERDLAEGVAKLAALPAASATVAGQVVPLDRDKIATSGRRERRRGGRKVD
jgi:integrase